MKSSLLSKLDTSGFGSGFIRNSKANYNPQLHQQDAVPGAWGPIFPVNWSGAFAQGDELDVVYYENPYRAHPDDNAALHGTPTGDQTG